MKTRNLSRRPASQKQKRRSFFSWLFPTEIEKRASRALRFESLEERRVLAVTMAYAGALSLSVGPTTNASASLGETSEATIAVNPTNPSNMIAFANDGNNIFGAGQDVIWFSTNNGSTWTQTVIPNPAGFQGRGDPTVAFDRAGNAYLTHLVTSGGSNLDLAVARSANGGLSWTNTFNTNVGTYDKEYMVIGPDPTTPAQDNIYIATRQTNGADINIHLLASYDGGATFPTDTTINDSAGSGTAFNSFPVPAIGLNGQLYVVWDEFNNAGGPTAFSRILVDSSANAGVTFGADQVVVNTNVSRDGTGGGGTNQRYDIPAQPERGILTVPSIAIAGTGPNAGRIYVSYTNVGAGGHNDTDIQLARSDSGLTGSWTSVRVNNDAGTNSQFFPWVATDPTTGFPSVTWNDARNSGSNNTIQRFGALSADGGLTFISNVAISAGTSNQSGAAAGANDYGDYNTHTAYAGRMFASWTDNSNSTGNNPDGTGNTDDYVSLTTLTSAGGATITATGGGGGDNYYIRTDPTGTYVQIFENPGVVPPSATTTPTFTSVLSAVTNIIVNGNGGNDLLTIDFVNGNPVPAGGLSYDGGTEAGTDLLVLRNGTFTTEVSSATGPGSGTIAFSGGALGTANITYTALEPVDDTVAVVNYTFNATVAGEIINIVNGPVTNGFQATQINSGSGTFELQNIANKTNVTVNALAGVDTITVNNPAPGVGMTTLVVDSGDGNDVVNVLTTPASVSTTLTSTSGGGVTDSVNVGNANLITGILGPVIVRNPPAFTTLTINNSADAVARPGAVLDQTLIGAQTFGRLTGLGNAGAIMYAMAATGDLVAVTINAGSGGNTLLINQPTATTNFFGAGVAANINLGSGNDTANIGPLSANVIYGINGQAGDDVFNVNAPVTIGSTLNIDGGPHVLGDSLNLNAGGADVVQNGNGQFVVGGPINYVNIETVLLTNLNSLTVNGDQGALINNQLVLTRTQANRFRSLLDAGPAVLFDRPLQAVGASFVFNGQTGDDTFTVDNGAVGGLVNLFTGYNGGTNSPVGTEVSGPPGDTLVITGNPGAVVARETYLVGATQDAGRWVLDPDDSMGPGALNAGANGDELTVAFTGLEPVDTDTPAAIFDVIMPGGAGTNDDLTIDNVGSPLNGFAAVHVNDNAGTFESFRFARKDVTRIMGNLNNAGGNDTFRINYATAPATASGGAFTLETFGHVAAAGDDAFGAVLGQPGDDSGNDVVFVSATPATTTNSLFGNQGDDEFIADGGGFGDFTLDDLLGTLNIRGQAGTDRIWLDGQLDGAADNGTLTGTQLTGVAGATINYFTVESFYLATTQGFGDTLDVLSTNLGTSYLLNGSGGSDTFTIGNQTADFNANTFDGTLVNILGPITIAPDFLGAAGTDTMNVDASGDGALAGVAAIDNVGPTLFTVSVIFGAALGGNTTRLSNFAIPNINYIHDNAGGNPSRLEFLNVRASTGNDVINVNDTTAVTQTTLDAREGSDRVTINGDNLSGANLFRGLGAPAAADGNDDFILNIGTHIGSNAFAPIVSVQIEGNANTAVDSANRDRLTINDNNAGFVRDLTFDYLDTQGDMDILATSAGNGLFGGAGAGLIPLNLRTLETLRFNGDAANNDIVTVSGTSTDDVITVGLASGAGAGVNAQSSAFVFLNGNPYIASPGAIVPPDSLAGNFPGIAGGGTGIDMLINGIQPANSAFGPIGGITLDGSGTSAIGNRAIVQALSENNLLDPVSAGGAVDVFNLGLGAGVLVPGTGANAGFDLISMNGAFAFDNDIGAIQSNPNQVLVQNIVSGLLVPVTVVPASFVNGVLPNSRAGLIANGGDEVAARGAGFVGVGISDNFFATPHPLFTLGVNGNLPGFGPLAPDGFPAGDQLNLTSPTSFSIWSDKQTPPNVNIMAGNGPFGVINSSIERTRLFPGNGVVNLIGDNNDATVDQTDNFVVVGLDIDSGSSADGGVQEMSVVINGSAPILIDGVNRLNTYGYDLVGQDLNSPFPNAPDVPATGATADDIDTLEITPFADNAGPNLFGAGFNAPRGWGVGVVFNEGSPAQQDGNQQDLLILHTSIGVNNGLNTFGGGIASEDIVVQPSGPDNGEVRVTNAVDGSVIVVISYINNTDLIIVDDDGSVSDTDTLTLRGTNPDGVQTSGNDTFVVDFDAAGTVAAPFVSVTDSANGNILYRLRSFTDPNGATGPFDTVTFDMLAGNDSLTFRTPISDPFDSLEHVNILGGLGDDSVTVDMDQRDIWHRIAGDGLFYDGGAGFDSLTISGAPAPLGIGNVVYTPGPIPGNGQITHSHPAGAGSAAPQVIDFVNLEPVIDLVPAAALIVNANNAANAINFASTPGDATRGRVSIDDQEYIDFSNKVTLTINALAGSDTINLTIPAAPPTGLTGINVDGGDPSNADTVNIFTTSAANTVTFTPTSAEGMNVIGLPGLATNVVITNTAAVTYDGNTPAAGTPNDILTISGTAGDDTTNVNPTGIGTATFQSGLSPLLTLRGFTALTANAGAGGFDDLIVTGTNAGDTLTSAANVLTMVGTVTIGANIDRLQINGLDGNDNINLTGVTIPTQITIYGGDGNDTLVGSPNVDSIYGEAGNDTITGGVGNDFLYGGDDGDTFIWNNGDNNDLMEGGTGTDRVIVNGSNTAGDIFTVNPNASDPTRVRFDRTNLVPFTLDIAAVEDLSINGLIGADSVTIADMATTELRNIDVDFGNGDAVADSIVINGRNVSDQVDIRQQNATTVAVTGLKYDIRVINAVAAQNDDFTFNGNAGNDTIVAADGLVPFFTSDNVAATNHFTLNGNDGDDLLSGYGRLEGGNGNDTLFGSLTIAATNGAQLINGGAGNDLISGGAGIDFINGGAGEDTILANFDGSVDVIDGGADFDTVIIQGTSGDDRIDFMQDDLAAGVTPIRFEMSGVNGGNGVLGGAGTETDNFVVTGGLRTVEEVRIVGGAGDDVIRVAHSDGMILNARQSLSVRISVEGGDPGASDRLTVTDDGPGDTTIQRVGGIAGQGSYTVGALAPVVYTGIEYTSLNPINSLTGGTGTDGAGRLFVFKYDSYEANNSLLNATYLGTDYHINLDPVIDPGADAAFGLPGDEDWYRVVASVNGTLDVRAIFREQTTLANTRAGLPANGNLDLQVYDAAGNLVPVTFGGNDGTGLNPELETNPNQNERVRIPAVAGQTYYIRIYGAGQTVDGVTTSNAINVYNLSVINTAAPVPTDIELLDTPVNTTTNPTNGAPGATAAGLSSDTGRSQRDNITFDNDPTILIRVPDVVQIAGSTFLADLPPNGGAPGNPPDEVIRIPFVPSTATNANAAGFRVAVFVTETNTGSPVLAGYAQPIVGQPGTFTFTFANDALVPDGSYFISARVEMIDPTSGGADTGLNQGFGDFATSLEVDVDTTAPPVFFGTAAIATDGLHPNSDSGVANMGATFSDRITNVLVPTFWGVAEADTIIRAYIDVNGNNAVDNTDIYIGTTVTIPLDGTNQSPNGQWELTSVVNMNDPNARDLLGNLSPLPRGGLRHIIVTAEDVAGNMAASNLSNLNIFIDDQGPQVTRVDVNSVGNSYNIWDHKRLPQGGDLGTLVPTPLVNSLVISFQDLPNRIALFAYDALKQMPNNVSQTFQGLFTVVGDYNGIIPIQTITLNNIANGINQPATATVTVTFDQPLPDDRYTLTISDEIQDPAGNHLDGESHAQEPLENPQFPSGNDISGGNFVARFTVDTRPEVGTWGAGAAWIDINGNTTFDQNNADFTNRDITFYMGYTSDNLFAGNFVKAPGGTADGFDKLASYGRVGTQWRWLVDVNNDGAITPGVDIAVVDPAGINGVPVAGDFDGNPANGDEVGLFTGTTWYFDTNHDFKVDLASAVPWTQSGYPVVGNFDGVAGDDLATYRDNTFYIDFGRNGSVDRTFRFGFPTPNNRPVSADMDQDGNDDLGLFVPNRAGVSPQEDAEWYILVSGGAPIVNRIHADPIDGVPVIDYTPVPFGNDLYIQYGDEFGLPILGNFDPPVTPGGTPTPLYPASNPNDPLDVNNDGTISAIDALLVINSLNEKGSYSIDTAGFTSAPFFDTDRDNVVSAHDVLLVLNRLNAPPASPQGGEGEGEAFAPTTARDAVFSQLGAEVAPVTSSGDAGILSLLADEQVRSKRSRQAE